MEGNRIRIAAGLLASVLLIGAAIVGFVFLKSWYESQEPQTYYLGDPGWSGYVGVTVSYDVEPVEVVLISPSGGSYGNALTFFGKTRRADVYETNEKERKITVLVDTDEPGGWSVQFPRLSNRSITYEFVTRMSPTLYLHGGDRILVDEDGTYYISFLASMEPDGADRCNYSVMLEKSQYSKMIASGQAQLNETTKVEIIPPEDRYDGTEYTIRLSVIMPPAEGSMRSRSAQKSFRIVLEPAGGNTASGADAATVTLPPQWERSGNKE